jgi:hypothetical protein
MSICVFGKPRISLETDSSEKKIKGEMEMKEFIKKISVVCIVALAISMVFSSIVYAGPSGQINKDNIQQYVNEAKAGNTVAASELDNYISGLKAFNKDAVKKALANVQIQPGETKTIDFGDGSSIVLSSTITSAAKTSTISPDTFGGNPIEVDGGYTVYVLGIPWGNLDVDMTYWVGSGTDNGKIEVDNVWETESASWGLTITEGQTNIIIDEGTTCEVNGVGHISGAGLNYSVTIYDQAWYSQSPKTWYTIS